MFCSASTTAPLQANSLYFLILAVYIHLISFVVIKFIYLSCVTFKLSESNSEAPQIYKQKNVISFTVLHPLFYMIRHLIEILSFLCLHVLLNYYYYLSA